MLNCESKSKTEMRKALDTQSLSSASIEPLKYFVTIRRAFSDKNSNQNQKIIIFSMKSQLVLY